MKVLMLYDYPPPPGGLPTQGDMLFRGLREQGVDAHAVHYESAQEKEWYYRWFQPDVVVGIGFWGHTPHLVLHPQRYGVRCVPWLVADGYVASYHEVLNSLPLILATSSWVREVYGRDGLDTSKIEILPVGCNTDAFIPRDSVTRVKPHPDHLIQAIKEMSIHHPERCLMVGDHPMDIEGGKRMGMKTAGVLTGKTTWQEFIKAGADLILDDATKIPGCIFKERAK